MSTLETQPPSAAATEGRVRPPSVLVVLVVWDGAEWVRQCLMSLSRQTHPRLSVLAVDNASTDGSGEILEGALGSERVLTLEENRGFAGAVGAALATPFAKEADYVLLMHDDTMLAPDAIAVLLAAAERIDGVGVVGPKVLDWRQESVLRDIGRSADRFGYPYSPLEDGEIDQGQYDRVREVLSVSSVAMLVARGVWEKVGPPDERLAGDSEDVDFCWRARLAGFRVLMTPVAEARHLGATVRRERSGTRERPPRGRYEQERAALASMLKNYRLVNLLWILPLYLVQGLARLLILTLSRRFEDAGQLLAAWGWNVAHLPSTSRRRVRAQRARKVGDRDVRPYMAPAGIRLRRLGQSAAQSILPRRDPEAEVEEASPLWRRLTRFVTAHPGLAAVVGAVVLALISYRHLLGASPLTGGALTVFPASASGFFGELVSGLRTTGLGGTAAASPALGQLGLASVLTFGSPPLLQKLLLLGLPGAAGLGCYRWVRSVTGRSLPAAVAGLAYALSAVLLWALSTGRIPTLVFLAGMPWLVRKLGEGFETSLRVAPVRWMVGAGLGLAVLVSFYPGALLAAVVVAVASALAAGFGPRLLRSVGMAGGALVLSLLLVFPFAWALARAGALGLSDPSGDPSFAALIRLSPGPGPGQWAFALFLPVAAALALIVVSPEYVRTAGRCTGLALAGIYLAWFSAAGHLPMGISNAAAYLGMAAVGMAGLVGLGLASTVREVRAAEFGYRQLGAALLSVVVGIGLAAQAAQAARGAWQVGDARRTPSSYLTVASGADGPYRVLWLGAAGDEPFPSPGGPSLGTVGSGRTAVRYSLTAPEGATALDTGRPPAGPGFDALRSTVEAIAGGRTRHAGAMLAPFGIRFVVAGMGDLPPAVQRRLVTQVDLDAVPSEGLVILENPKAALLAEGLTDPTWAEVGLAGRADPSATATLPAPTGDPLDGSDQRYEGRASDATTMVLLAQEGVGSWRLEQGDSRQEPLPAFGWAAGFRPPPAGGAFQVEFGGQRVRTSEMAVLALMWMAGLWITRRPVRGG